MCEGRIENENKPATRPDSSSLSSSSVVDECGDATTSHSDVENGDENNNISNRIAGKEDQHEIGVADTDDTLFSTCRRALHEEQRLQEDQVQKCHDEENHDVRNENVSSRPQHVQPAKDRATLLDEKVGSNRNATPGVHASIVANMSTPYRSGDVMMQNSVMAAIAGESVVGRRQQDTSSHEVHNDDDELSAIDVYVETASVVCEATEQAKPADEENNAFRISSHQQMPTETTLADSSYNVATSMPDFAGDIDSIDGNNSRSSTSTNNDSNYHSSASSSNLLLVEAKAMNLWVKLSDPRLRLIVGCFCFVLIAMVFSLVWTVMDNNDSTSSPGGSSLMPDNNGLSSTATTDQIQPEDSRNPGNYGDVHEVRFHTQCGTTGRWKQRDYRGTINTTISGRPCLKWQSELLPTDDTNGLTSDPGSNYLHKFNPVAHPNVGLEENYCR